MTETIAELLANLAALDVRLWLEGSSLRCDAPQGSLTPGLLAALRARKQEIIDFLAPRERRRSGATFDPLAPEFVADPYPAYAALRSEQPVYRSPMGHWVLTRYEDVRSALLNPVFTNAPASYSWLHARHRATSIGADVANNILPFMDGEAHAQARRLVASVFSNQLRTRPVDLDTIADDVIEPFMPVGRVDLVNDFGRPFATHAICALLGLARADHARIAQWGDAFLYLLTGVQSQEHRETLESALREFRSYCEVIVKARKASPTGDLLSAWLAVGDDEFRLTDAQVVDTCMLVVADGIENVASLIGSSIALLIERPEELARVRDDADYARKAALECLRFETPGQYIARVAGADVVLGGQTIRQGESVLLVLGAANRDESVYPDAASFCPMREHARHLSFGRGRHTCLGAQLVPLELEAAFRTLLGRLPGLRLAPPAGQWRSRPGHRWLDACPVEFDAA